jgi:hypothetical protein
MRKMEDRRRGYKALCDQEIQALKSKEGTNDPAELYWNARRYSELGLSDCLSPEEMDKRVVSLLQRAIELKEDFGPAYFDLARQNLYMDRTDEALEIATKGHKKSHYEACLKFIQEIDGQPTVTIIFLG